MADFLNNIASRFEASIQDSQSNTAYDSQLQQLEAQRDSIRNHHNEPTNNMEPTSTVDANTRLSRRERLIRQSTQPRVSDRRSHASYIQRAPVRSSSLDVTGTTDDPRNFRDLFERQPLFGSRTSGSSENLTGSPRLGRRNIDTSTYSSRLGHSGSDSGSGRSSPQVSYSRASQNLAESLTEAFAKSFDTIEGTNIHRSSPITTREPREPRNPSSTYQRTSLISSASNNNFQSSIRRERDSSSSRYRRRTIQGVDRNVREALEKEKRATDDYFGTSRLQNSPLVEEKDDILSTRTYTRSAPNTFRKINIHKEDTIPVLGQNDDLIIFVDNSGRVHWIKDNRTLLRALKTKQQLPEIVVKDNGQNHSQEDIGYISSLEGDKDARYRQLNQHFFTFKAREYGYESDETDGLMCPEIIEEKFKSFSLYKPPRQRQNIEDLVTAKEVPSLYDGIDMSEVTTETQGTVNIDIKEKIQVKKAFPPLYTLSFAHLRETSNFDPINAQVNILEQDGPSRGVTIQQPEGNLSTVNEIDSFEEPRDVNLVLERLHGMGMSLDTTNLDYDELMMIQRALEDNPSPPESPYPANTSYDEGDSRLEIEHHIDTQTSENVVSERVEQIVTNSIERSVEPLETNVTQTVKSSSIESQSAKQRDACEDRSERPASQNNSNEEVVINESFEVENIHAYKNISSDDSDDKVQETNESFEIDIMPSFPSDTKPGTAQMTVKMSVISSSTADKVEELSDAAATSTPIKGATSSIKATPPSSLPSGRLPSDSAISPKLPLPSIDWSPLEKKSKKELEFPDVASRSSRGGSVSDRSIEHGQNGAKSKIGVNDSTEETFEDEVITEEVISPSIKPPLSPIERVNEVLNRPNGERITQQLTVEIPSETRDTESSKRNSLSATTPVKSRNSSVNSQGVSPAESDTVTTIFEEFIAELPPEVLEQLGRTNN